MHLSLLITTFNRKEALSLVLASALRQTRLPDEILVADDGSTDGTGEMVRDMAVRTPVPIRYCWQEDQGFRAARARNLAIAASLGEYLVMIDGDMVLESHFIADHLAFARPSCFVQGSRVLLNEKTTVRLLAGEIFPLYPWSAGLGNRKNAIRLTWLARLFFWRTMEINGIRTCNFGIWRADALAVNGFDEEFVGWGREDSEFAARLLHKGVSRRNLRFAALAYHLFHPGRSRASLPANDQILSRTMEEKRIWCANGLDRHQ